MFIRRLVPPFVLFGVCSWVAISDRAADASLAAGPDAFGYGSAEISYGFVPLATTGTALSPDDLNVRAIALPFDFSFYGRDYTSVYISPHGTLRFGAGTVPGANAALPSSGPGAPDVAVYWDEFDLSRLSWGLTPHGVIGWPTGKVLTLDDVPNARFIISWEGVVPRDDCNITPGDVCPPDWNTNGAAFQVHLYENGRLEFHYQDTEVADPSLSNAASATIGIQDASGGTFDQNHVLVAYDTTSVLQGKAISIATAVAGGGTAGTAGATAGTGGGAGSSAGGGGTSGGGTGSASAGTVGSGGTVGSSGTTGTGGTVGSSGTTGTGGTTAPLCSFCPPDPEIHAPPADRSQATNLYTATGYLWEAGPGQVQVGVQPGAILPKFVSVIRGRTIERLGAKTAPAVALPGVRVSVVGRPEFGTTITREDGYFDLVVNGTGDLRLRFEKLSGPTVVDRAWLRSERVVTPRPFERISMSEEVALIEVEPLTTEIDLSASAPPVQTHVTYGPNGTSIRHVLMFHRGTQVDFLYPDASQPGGYRTTPYAGTELNVSSTEFTVDDRGPQAMPADLPPTSAYTYAVEFAADEAIAAGAERVKFRHPNAAIQHPVVSYVENALGFSVGTDVPAGAYDDVSGLWRAEESGCVVELRGIDAGGGAMIWPGSCGCTGGVTCPSNPDTVAFTAGAAQLAQIGITDDERKALAQLYPGASVMTPVQLWRVPTSHFTEPWDLNWGYEPQCTRCLAPPGPPPQVKSPSDCESKHSGSIIGCETQSLGESLPVVGTPFTLNYQSRMQLGYADDRTISFRLAQTTGPDAEKTVEPSSRGFRGWIDVAGQTFGIAAASSNTLTTYSKRWLPKSYIPPDVVAQSPNLTFTWDGKDAEGRYMQGSATATVTLEHCVEGTYDLTGRFGHNMANAYSERSGGGGGGGSGGVAVQPTIPEPICFRTSFDRDLRVFDAQAYASLGGWTLSPHHFYDALRQTLYRGDGTVERTGSFSQVVTTVLGNGHRIFPDLGAQTAPLDLALMSISDIAFSPRGELYFAEEGRHTVRKVDPGFTVVTHVAGVSGQAGYDASSENGLASTAKLHTPVDLEFSPDGTLHVVEKGTHRVRAIGLDGRIRTVVGTGTPGHNGDFRQAVASNLTNPRDMAFDKAGNMLIAEDLRLRQVDTTGMTTTIAGKGTHAYEEGWIQTYLEGRFNLPLSAVSIGFSEATAIALGDNGDIYLAVNAQTSYIGGPGILRVTPDGKAIVFAGTTALWESEPFGSTSGGFTGPLRGHMLYFDKTLYVARENGIAAFSAHTRKGVPYLNAFTRPHRSLLALGPDGTGPRDTVTGWIYGLTRAPNGELYFGERMADGASRARRIGPGVLRFDGESDVEVPSRDGSELYVFTARGRHLRTIDVLTGQTVWTMKYDARGRLIEVRDRFNAATQIARDASGKVTAIISHDGQMTKLRVGAGGYLERFAEPGGDLDTSAYAFTHSPTGLLTEFKTPRGHATTFSYDLGGRLIGEHNPAAPPNKSVTLARTVPTQVGFDDQVTLTTAEGRSKIARLGGQGVQVKGERVAFDGTVSSVQWDEDRLTSITAADGTKQSLKYKGDPMFQWVIPLATEEVSTPAGLKRTTAHTRTVSGASAGNAMQPLQSLVGHTRTDTVAVNGRSTTFEYTPATTTTRAVYELTTPTGRVASTDLSASGLPVKVLFADLAPVEVTYDARGRVTGVTQTSGGVTRSETVQRDGLGRVEKVTDALGRETTYEYDTASRVVKVKLPDLREVGYAYDADGNVTQVVPPSRAGHAFTYDEASRTSSYVPPPLGVIVPTTTYAYDADHKVELATRPDGQTIDWEYSVATGRLAKVKVSGGEYVTTYDANGRLLSVTDPAGGKLAYTYDGSLMKSEVATGQVPGRVAWVYDADFRVEAETVNGAFEAKFAYDNDGLLVKAGAQTMTRDPETGLVTDTVLGTVRSSMTYDGFGELETKEFRNAAGAVYAASYTKDAVGRVTSKVETIAGATTTRCYEYDVTGRLTRVTDAGVSGGACGGTTVEAYGYDGNSNRTAATTSLGSVTSADVTVDGHDRLTKYGDWTFTYTLNGELDARTNTVTGKTVDYSYDVLGNLKQVQLENGEVVVYVTDARGRRVGRRRAGGPLQGFVYGDDLEPVAELDDTGAVVSRFVYGLKGHVPDLMERGGSTYAFVTDHVGSVVAVVDTATGTVEQRMAYDAFGRVLVDTNPGFQPFGFAGGLYDRDTGLVLFGARDYDPATGRWTAKDPIGFAGGDVNLYGYVFADPVNWIDPEGLDAMGTASDAAAGFGDWLSFGLTAAIRESMDASSGVVNPCSGAYLGGQIAGAGLQVVFNASGFVKGYEFAFRWRKFRLAPWGNRTGNPFGRWPHYHRIRPHPNPREARRGGSAPGQGKGRHRPWESDPRYDRNWWDRF